MIITDRIVVLNNPKTGSTFVRTVLKQLHGHPAPGPRLLQRALRRLGLRRDTGLTELLLPVPGAVMPMPPNQHGGYCQIPPQHRGKEIMSVVRDPFARLLSIFRFRWWSEYPGVAAHVLERHFPTFPDLTLEQYLRLEEMAMDTRLNGRASGLQVGRQTIRFIDMFFRDPPAVLGRLDADYLDSDQFLEDLPCIRFLSTERLNQQLHAFLLEHGYPPARLQFILDHERVNATPGQPAGDEWTDALVASYMHRERLLFRILGHLGFTYSPPVPRTRRMPGQDRTTAPA
jgi:hypothetical protein